MDFLVALFHVDTDARTSPRSSVVDTGSVAKHLKRHVGTKELEESGGDQPLIFLYAPSLRMLSELQNHLLHALLIGPAFFYIGYMRDQIPSPVFTGLLVVGAVVLLYHLYRAFTKIKDGKSAWINWIHIFLVAPLLLLIGYLGKDAERRYFEMMILLGFAATGYHALYAVRSLFLE